MPVQREVTYAQWALTRMAHALFDSSPPDWNEVVEMSRHLKMDCGCANAEEPEDVEVALVYALLAVDVIEEAGRENLDVVKVAVLDALRSVDACLQRHGDSTFRWPIHWAVPPD